MTSRIDQPNTDADMAIRNMLDQPVRQGFTVVAGAGSGKTTSLVKALAHVLSEHGAELESRTQQAACITYTEVAAREIHAEVVSDPRVLVSTIHSFLWTLAKPFQPDIRRWVIDRIAERISELDEKILGYGPRVQARTKEKDAAELAKYKLQRDGIHVVTRFVYGTGSDYSKGTLGHEDVLTMVPELVMTRPLLAKIAARRFPFIFVDESQDTFPNVVECLKRIQVASEGTVSLGFFGDPMQQIYQRGVGSIEAEGDWVSVPKPENFRSSNRVLEVMNAVRAGGDSLVQVPGRSEHDRIEGETYFFVMPADAMRTSNLERIRTWLDTNGAGGCWTDSVSDDETKILTIVHRMAAGRLGFGRLFEAFNDNKSSLKDDFTEGTAWPLRAFEELLFPIIDAAPGDGAAVIDAIRKNGLLFGDGLSSNLVKLALGKGASAIAQLREIAARDSEGSVGSALTMAIEEGLLEPDPRLAVFLDPTGEHGDVVLSEGTSEVLRDLMGCRIDEIRNYRNYVERNSPYSTQHGTKGAEFDKVIVVLDDEEGKYNLYSYEKYLGLRELSDIDGKKVAAGEETTIDRTRRLFYVCVSRAKESLAVVLFTADVDAAARKIRESDIVASARVLTPSDLGNA